MGNKNMLFISPHLDDVVFSCSGYINKISTLGYAVHVLTLFSGSPEGNLSMLARALHRDWHLPIDAAAARREEDRQALSMIGAKAIHAHFLDCIYRRNRQTGKPLYRRIEQVLEQKSINEPQMVEAVRDYLADIIQNGGYDHVFAPLGLGGHVDHLITHAAVRLVENSSSAAQIHYYEDLPYAIDQPLDETRGAGMDNYLCFCKGGERKKHQAMAQYTSQIKSPRYPGGIDIDAIIDYGERVDKKTSVFAERVWFKD